MKKYIVFHNRTHCLYVGKVMAKNKVEAEKEAKKRFFELTDEDYSKGQTIESFDIKEIKQNE